MDQGATPDTGCDAECATPGRRDFLRDGLMAVAALAAVGIGADRLAALTLAPISARRVGDLLRYPLPAADGASIDTANEVVVVRFQGFVHAFSAECPHRGTTIEWQPGRGRFYCPKHKSTFQPEGTLIQGKAERNLDRFVVRVEGSEVVVDTARKIRSDRNAEEWAAAKIVA